MTEAEIEVILQAAKEKYPDARPRIISDIPDQHIWPGDIWPGAAVPIKEV